MRRIRITIPDDQAAAVEQIRRRRGVSRSRVVQDALALTLAEEEKARAVRRYVEGYRRRPETGEATAFARAATAVLAEERWT